MQILPSGHGPAAPGQARLTLAPFRGLRYAPERVSGLAEVTSPPYDVIAHDIADQLLAADPHNVVRLILPQGPGARGDAYRDAARRLRDWQEAGILRPDPGPALYIYEQAAAGVPAHVMQRGFIGAVRLSPPEAGVVRPHEDVAPGPVAGRLQLMEATQANLEPIFLLHEGADGRGGGPGPSPGNGAAARAVAQAPGEAPLADIVTADAIRHRLWAVTDPGELAAIAADLAPRSVMIADGHHRYAAYLALQARRQAAGAGPGPWDYGLALLVDASAYPPDIGAIHRVIPRLRPEDASRQASAAFAVRGLAGGTDQLCVAMDRLAEASKHGTAFLVAGGGKVSLLTDPDTGQLDAAMPPGRSAHWRALAASVLEELLLGRVWKVGDSEQDVWVVHNDAAEAVRQAEQTGGTAVICSPMLAEDVYEIAAAGERVPRKSTSFGPKPRTGLVIRTFAQG